MANNISDATNLHTELAHLMFKENRYSTGQIHRAFHLRGRPSDTATKQKTNHIAFVPHVKNLANRIIRIRAWYNNKKYISYHPRQAAYSGQSRSALV
jgi:hypothetical protein